MKKKLNIIIADGSSSESYVDYLNINYDITVLDFNKLKNDDKVDLILFTGGSDVNPEEYGEETGKYTSIDLKRDSLEIKVFKKFRYVPKLGICRGAQLLTVLSGGKLIQHVTGHSGDHNIVIDKLGTFVMTSTHHQMMNPYNLDKESYSLKAWSKNFLSDTYLNGLNSEISLDKEFLEPEIVEYFNTKSLCIQGHPEFGNDSIKEVTLMLLDNFLNSKSFQKNIYLRTDQSVERMEPIGVNLKRPSQNPFLFTEKQGLNTKKPIHFTMDQQGVKKGYTVGVDPIESILSSDDNISEQRFRQSVKSVFDTIAIDEISKDMEEFTKNHIFIK